MKLEYEELAVEFDPCVRFSFLVPQIPNALIYHTSLQGMCAVLIYSYRLCTEKGRSEWFKVLQRSSDIYKEVSFTEEN